jgi:site-specific DNA-methyltransferase (adenine-specific)
LTRRRALNVRWWSKLGLPGYHLNPHDGGEALGHGLSSSTYETRLKSSQITAPATNAARQWQGWGTALKPAMEPITVARKPLAGTVAENVLEHGTGALNIDGCRVATDDKLGGGAEKAQNAGKIHEGWQRPWMNDQAAAEAYAARIRENVARSEALGRWPANLIHDGSDEVVGLFPITTSGGGQVRKGGDRTNPTGWTETKRTPKTWQGDSGSAARFFYCAKASKKDRDEGLEGFEKKATLIGAEGLKINPMTSKPVVDIPRANTHPTVKPTDLMRYLCRLVTPPGGVVLDPFMGSGSTGKAAKLEGFRFIGIEREAEYVRIAQARIDAIKGGQLSLDL